MVDDSPMSLPNGDGTQYVPQNYDGRFRGREHRETHNQRGEDQQATAAEQPAGFDFGQQLLDTGQRAITTESAVRREVLAALAGMLAQHPGFAPGRGAEIDGGGLCGCLCGVQDLFRHR